MVLLYTGVYAQDVIYMNDGREIKGKVTRIDDNTVKYIKAGDSDGYEKTLGKVNVAIILYENGTHEVIEKETTTSKKLKTNFGRHQISWDYLEIFALNTSFAYEYFTKSGKFGVKIPVSLGLTNPWAVERLQLVGQQGRILATGVDINYYPFGQGVAAYFLGPSFGYGTMRYFPEGDYFSRRIFMEQYSLHFVQGVMLHLSERITLTGVAGIGLLQKHSPVYDWTWEQNQSLILRGSIGYRFGYSKE